MLVPFGEFRPDLAAIQGVSVNAHNVLPAAEGYREFPSFVQRSDAISARCRGAVAVRGEDGEMYVYAGNDQNLYDLADAAHTNVNKVATTYALSADSYWKFKLWGDTLVATCIDHYPQTITLGGANFADLQTVFKARYVTVIDNFMVFAHINDGTLKPKVVRWSAINDNTDYTQDPDTMSDSQKLYSEAAYGGGNINGITGGEFGNVFMDYSIWRMTYVGLPLIFSFEEIAPGVGCPYPNSIVQQGNNSFFLGIDGFYMLMNGTTPRQIGKGKVDRWFLDRLSQSQRYRIVGAADPASPYIVWIYPSLNASAGTPDSIIVYDWAHDKWSTGEEELEWIYAAPQAGYTLEELDAISSSIDTLTPSLDSEAWKSKGLALAAYDDEEKQGHFTGTGYDALIDVMEAQLFPGRRAFVKGARPIFTGTNATGKVALGSRNNPNDSITFTAQTSLNSRSGMAPFRSDARYHRARAQITGGFGNAVGIEYDAVPSSKL